MPLEKNDYYFIKGYELDIVPRSEFVIVQNYSYSRTKDLYEEELIFDPNLSINATEAYAIVEEHVGFEARSQQENRHCEAVIMIDEDDNNKWHIWYTDKDGVIFEGLVDRESGKFKKIPLKK